MSGKQSLSLIAVLVAALLAGPLLLQANRAKAAPLRPISASAERIVDAPAPLPLQAVPAISTVPFLRR